MNRMMNDIGRFLESDNELVEDERKLDELYKQARELRTKNRARIKDRLNRNT